MRTFTFRWDRWSLYKFAGKTLSFVQAKTRENRVQKQTANGEGIHLKVINCDLEDSVSEGARKDL